MSSFSESNFNSSDYNQFRPRYPVSFYDMLREYVGSEPKLAVDLACGTGQATRALAEFCESVQGIDASETMIGVAKKDAPDNVQYRVGSDETLTTDVEAHSVDLITVAEGAHWLKYPEFWERAHSVLRKGGTLAMWAYWSFSIIGYPETSDIIADYAYGEDKLGPLWDNGREILDRAYRDLIVPTSLFDQEVRRINMCYENKINEPFQLVRENVPLEAVISMLKTWSAYHKWKRLNPTMPDIADKVLPKLCEATGLQPTSLASIKWSTVYVLAKAK